MTGKNQKNQETKLGNLTEGERFAFQYLERKNGKHGNIKKNARKKSGNLDKMSFDENGS